MLVTNKTKDKSMDNETLKHNTCYNYTHKSVTTTGKDNKWQLKIQNI